MRTLSIDIETFSPEPLAKCGVYRYCQAPEFEVLLFGYSVDSDPVQVVDLTCQNGEGVTALDNVSFDAYGGEILGIAGIAGSGQKELCEGIDFVTGDSYHI